jgi:hypothetical protein
MQTIIKYPHYALLLIVLLPLSCKDKNHDPDCGCDSPAISTIHNVQASYIGGNHLKLHLKNPNDTAHEDIYELCTPSDTLSITPNADKPNYTISGKVKKVCFYGPTFAIQYPLLEITEIRKIL